MGRINTKSLTPIDPNASGDVRVRHAFPVDGKDHDAARETMAQNAIEVMHEDISVCQHRSASS